MPYIKEKLIYPNSASVTSSLLQVENPWLLPYETIIAHPVILKQNYQIFVKMLANVKWVVAHCVFNLCHLNGFMDTILLIQVVFEKIQDAIFSHDIVKNWCVNEVKSRCMVQFKGQFNILTFASNYWKKYYCKNLFCKLILWGVNSLGMQAIPSCYICYSRGHKRSPSKIWGFMLCYHK